MKHEIAQSCISVPIPTGLFIQLVDRLGGDGIEGDPVSAVTAAIENWLAGGSRPSGESATADAARWPTDWISFPYA